MELLKNRSPIAADDAARWGAKILELGVLTPKAQVLTTERIAECYISRTVAHLAAATGTCKRQAAFWSLMASDSWLRLDRREQARSSLRKASALYALSTQDSAELPFSSMQGLWQRLVSALKDAGGEVSVPLLDRGMTQDDFESSTTGELEHLNVFNTASIPSSNGTEGFSSQDTSHVTSMDDTTATRR